MKKIFIILIGICSSVGALAQSNVSLTYPISIAMGDMGDFVGKTSWRGLSLDYRYMVDTNVGVGLNLSWTTFYEEKANDTYTIGNESLSGKQFRYSNNVPIVATVAYFLSPEETVNPFFSMGIGTMYTRRNTDMNLYTMEQEAWNFLLQPEVGVQYKVNEQLALHLSGKYNHGLKAGSELTEAQSYFSINVGFAFF